MTRPFITVTLRPVKVLPLIVTVLFIPPNYSSRINSTDVLG